MYANDQLREYTGSENYFAYNFGYCYTDGVRALVNMFECYWLLDIIVSYQPQLRGEEFQVWTLTVKEDHTAVVSCTDGNDKILKSQEIPFIDFKAKEAMIWVEGDVMLLPSEH